MIRWYDYIAVFVYASFITTLLFLGFVATEWYMPLIAGAVVGYSWRSWNDFYCQWRLDQERTRK